MRTELSDIGEFGLINRIKSQVQLRQASTIKGIGDDAAVIAQQNGVTVISTDMMIEGVHFDLGYVPLAHLGYKAIVTNVSDIAAMNAICTQVTVSIAFSNRFSVEAIEELYKGFNKACEYYNVDLVGGDTSSSPSGLIISITAIGVALPERLAYRNGAKAGEVICLTGDLGGAYLGLQILEREKVAFSADPNYQPDFGDKEYLVERQLKPEARTDIVYELDQLGVVPTSMIDISDGLASELLHICKESNIGAAIYEEHLPFEDVTVLTAQEFDISHITAALNGGEDYELLFTVTKEDWEKIKLVPDVAAIGITRDAEDGVLLVSSLGNPYPITAQGFIHF